MPKLSPKQAYLQAQDIYNQGRYRSAIKITEPLFRQLPNHPPVVVLHTSTLLRLARAEEAAKITRRALRTISNHQHRTLVISNLAEALNQLHSSDEAIALLRDESEARPDDPYLVAALAQILVIQNKYEDAIAITQAALDRGINHVSVATGFANAAINTDQRDKAIAVLESAIEQSGPIPATTRAAAYTVLGHLFDKSARYDQAFDAYTKHNELCVDTYDDDMVQARVSQITTTWTPESFVGVERAQTDGLRPVFIIGMPRSGTTLTEQILDAHPQAFGAGELEILQELYHEAAPSPKSVYTTPPADYDPARITSVAIKYRQELVRCAGSDTFAVISDKAPGNYWYMGFIALAFPDAKIVHCLRDPRDTCLSCYFQPLSPSHSFSFDLANCGNYYRHYHNYTKHMTQVLKDPRVGIDVLEMHYEDTVVDLEAQTRRLLDFVGLDFHEDCLNYYQSGRVAMTLSNDQVRKPIYTSSTKRHERYAAHIGPLVNALGDLLPRGQAT